VKLSLVPLPQPEAEKLRRQFTAPPWELLVTCIESEMEFEAHRMKLDAVQSVLHPGVEVSVREQAIAAGRLQIALEVLAEFSEEGKTLSTLQIEP
jgi:hypothetical protein